MTGTVSVPCRDCGASLTFSDFLTPENPCCPACVSLREERSGCAICGMSYPGSHYLGCPAADAAEEPLRHALEALQRATAELDRLWSSARYSGDEISGYPSYLPSFDDFAADVAAMRLEAGR